MEAHERVHTARSQGLILSESMPIAIRPNKDAPFSRANARDESVALMLREDAKAIQELGVDRFRILGGLTGKPHDRYEVGDSLKGIGEQQNPQGCLLQPTFVTSGTGGRTMHPCLW